jgi:signal transduction histidine kinase/CheY-like chemotaxis protein
MTAIAGPEPTAPVAELDLPEIPADLRRMHGRPFGRDERGEPIAHGSGRIVVGAIRYMQSLVADRIERAAPEASDPDEVARLVERARGEALDRLVAMLNAAIEDERYHVTPAYLLSESNNYSYEFRLFAAEYCRLLAGEPDFFVNQGRRSIPNAIVQLSRPIGIRQTYAILPRFTAKYVQTDLRVVRTDDTSAIVRWYAGSQLRLVPPELHRRYIDYACQAYRGTFASIPLVGFGQPAARIEQRACQLDGDDYCEWEFTWIPIAGGSSRRDVALGMLGSFGLLGYFLLEGPLWVGVAVVAATLLPAGIVLYGGSARRRAHELRRQQTLLLEQRELSEREYDRSEQANVALQQANLDLEQRVAELMTLNEAGVALSTTLDIDELLDRSLRAVVAHLRFDRAMVLLADEDRGVLAGGRSVGGTAEMESVVSTIELPLDHPTSQLVELYRADGPMLFRDVDRDDDERNREFAALLGVTAFLGTPLVSKGRTVGIMAVDNRLSGREVEPGDGPLLFTVGNLIASAVENARLYREIEAHNRELERRVEERTDALARATVEAQEARAAAEAASETKSSFLTNVSHELRTPLTSVVGFSKIIAKRLDDVVFPAVASDDPRVERAMRQVGENLDIISSEGERLTTMINDVLDLAKIESGRMEWRRVPVHVEELVLRASGATSSLIAHAGLTLVTDIEPDLPPVIGDRDRLIQVVINLLSNAVKFTPSGSITCTARRDGPSLVFAVTDTGVGIAPEDHAKVFEQFRQAGDTLTDKPRGTGLGLPICREIVEHHGGRIWVESEVGRGSTFAFALPIPSVEVGWAEGGEPIAMSAGGTGAGGAADGLAEGGADGGAPIAGGGAGIAVGPHHRILVVEDDPGTRELVRQALESNGYLVEIASDGEQALTRVAAAPPTLVILDVMLPGLDGFGVVERLKAGSNGNVPILMLTIVDEPERAARLGVDAYLRKPFDTDELLRHVRRLTKVPTAG